MTLIEANIDHKAVTRHLNTNIINSISHTYTEKGSEIRLRFVSKAVSKVSKRIFVLL